MKRYITVLSIAALALVSCNQKQPDGPQPAPAGKSLWKMKNDPVECVSVYCGKTLVQSFNYEYDKEDRVVSIKRVDELTKAPMMNLDITYGGIGEMTVSGSYLYANRTFKASFNEDRDMLTYGAQEEGFLTNILTMDSDDLPGVCKGTYDFSAKNYDSAIAQKTVYGTGNCDILSIAFRTETATKTDELTECKSERTVEYDYTYSDEEDLQNFAAYLIPCDFPVWYAAELPGCAHLITGMTCKCGNVTLPQSFEVKYVLNDNGSIRSATRTDYTTRDGNKVRVSELRYEFSYE